MEVLYLLTNLIDGIFIKGLFISILSIMIAGKVLKADTRNAFTIIKVLILVYAGLNIGYYFLTCFSPVERATLWRRATGSYCWAFYLMFVPNTLLPVSLLFKRAGYNKYVLLTLSFLMNIGWILELFVMYNTDLHKDIMAIISFNYLWFILLEGVFMGAVIYAIGRAIKRKVQDTHTPIS